MTDGPQTRAACDVRPQPRKGLDAGAVGGQGETIMSHHGWMLAACAFVALACGNERDAAKDKTQDAPSQFVTPAYACTPGGPLPSSKLVLHPAGGIANRFIVVLMQGTDVTASAEALASKYDGQILAVYDVVLGGFAIRLDSTRATELASEPSVCWVEQDAVVSGNV